MRNSRRWRVANRGAHTHPVSSKQSLATAHAAVHPAGMPAETRLLPTAPSSARPPGPGLSEGNEAETPNEPGRVYVCSLLRTGGNAVHV